MGETADFIAPERPMTTRRLFGLFGLCALLAAAAPAQDEKKDDKKPAGAAAPGEVVPGTFRMYLVTDDRFPPVKQPDMTDKPDPRNRTNKMHCLVCEYGLSPTVAIFVRADPKGLENSGLSKLVKAVDQLVPKYRGDKLSGFVAFLRLEGGVKAVKVKNPDGTETDLELDNEYPDDEKRDDHAKEIRALANALRAANPVFNLPFGLAAVKSKALAAWGVKDDDEVSVVIYTRLRVVNRWTFKADAIGDDQIKEVLSGIEKMIADQSK